MCNAQFRAVAYLAFTSKNSAKTPPFSISFFRIASQTNILFFYQLNRTYSRVFRVNLSNTVCCNKCTNIKSSWVVNLCVQGVPTLYWLQTCPQAFLLNSLPQVCFRSLCRSFVVATSTCRFVTTICGMKNSAYLRVHSARLHPRIWLF